MATATDMATATAMAMVKIMATIATTATATLRQWLLLQQIQIQNCYILVVFTSI
jgi:hypothetical protein